MTSTKTTSPSPVARLNDCFRRHPNSDWVMTAAVQAKGLIFALCAVNAVGAFDAFTSDTDPYGGA